MDNSVLINELREYGADIDGIKSRFMGDIKFYARCFYSSHYEEIFATLDSAVKGERYSDAFSAAHELKGLTGNLGLTPLYNCVCVLVESLRKKDYSSVKDEYAKVQIQIKRVEEILMK